MTSTNHIGRKPGFETLLSDLADGRELANLLSFSRFPIFADMTPVAVNDQICADWRDADWRSADLQSADLQSADLQSAVEVAS